MIRITQESTTNVIFSVDTKIFNERVITKVLYWLSEIWHTYQHAEKDIVHIRLEKKKGTISADEFRILKERLNQDFIDFKTRDIVNQETLSVRNLLLIKAFSVSDEFDEKNIFPDEGLI